jgi:hypothetical protein
MKLFPQLALVSAIAISGSAFAMEALNDATLSNTTGQDGITIKIKPPTKAFDATYGTSAFTATGGFAGTIGIDHLYVHDKDGYNGSSDAGAIVLDGFAIGGNAPILVDIDADGNGGNPLLNVKVTLPTTLLIHTGTISVAGSNRVAGSLASVKGIKADQVQILDNMDINLGGATLNIQLGNESQGAMIKTTGTITGGLSIKNFALNDNAGVLAAAPSSPYFGTKGGSISIGEILVTDTGATDLTLAASIDASAAGLVITVGGNKSDIMLADVRLGDKTLTTSSIGDVEIVGLNLVGSEIAITGH